MPLGRSKNSSCNAATVLHAPTAAFQKNTSTSTCHRKLIRNSSIGALFTHLAPTAIALPSYFVFADLVLISQCAYYNARNARKAKKAARTTSEASEDSPLLARRRSSLAAQHNHGQSSDTHGKPVAEEVEKSTGSIWVQNALSLLAVYVVGIVAFFTSYKAGAWNTTDPDPGSPEDVNDPLEWVGLTMGYVSAVFYLCARLPQIWKNYKDKSCEGMCSIFVGQSSGLMD